MKRDLRPYLEGKIDQLHVLVYTNRQEAGIAAAANVAERIMRLLEEKNEVRIIFAAAPSQDEMLAHLSQYCIDWSRVTAFQMDEYVGLKLDDPRSFSNYLREHLFNIVRPGKVYIMDTTRNLAEESKRYARLLTEAPIDIICCGIGENGHIAFNEPGETDFSDSELVKLVSLDERSRLQQVRDGIFSSLEEVPTQALTITVPVFMSAHHVVGVVPGPSKREAIRRTLWGPVSPECPASILRTHRDAVLFLDMASYGMGI